MSNSAETRMRGYFSKAKKDLEACNIDQHKVQKFLQLLYQKLKDNQ